MTQSHWMIRTSKNLIFGPFSRDEVAQKVCKGELELHDELCPATGYWFYLHELEEVKKFLGVQPPARRPNDSDLTQTETHADNEITDPELDKKDGHSQPRVDHARTQPQVASHRAHAFSEESPPSYPWGAIALVILAAIGAMVLVWMHYFRGI